MQKLLVLLILIPALLPWAQRLQSAILILPVLLLWVATLLLSAVPGQIPELLLWVQRCLPYQAAQRFQGAHSPPERAQLLHVQEQWHLITTLRLDPLMFQQIL